jgi:hypothetical protein
VSPVGAARDDGFAEAPHWCHCVKPGLRSRGAAATGENARVSTRTLLVLAAITGFVILAAFAIQIFLSR